MSDSSYGSVYVEGVTYIDEREIAKRDAEIERLREGERAADAEIERLRELRDTMLKGEVAIRQRDADEIERLRGLLAGRNLALKERDPLLDFDGYLDLRHARTVLRKRVREALGDAAD